ncbi:unnamed protein product [Calicophoron daubneyi]|uniref:Uncharacterized protein n=1 Tax=Calicophoron daubneyi TaxID=300641 RepID=A0AAV2TVP7_CALDB
MVRFALQLKCDLTNITNLRPDGEDFRWYVRTKCGNCGQDSAEFIYFCSGERVPLKEGRGDVNLSIRCKFCSRSGSIDIVPDSYSSYNAEDSGSYKTIIILDCRGVEPTEFSPRVGWAAQGLESNTEFSDVSLTDKNWCDFDADGNCEVDVFNVESRFVKVKH